MPDKLVEATSDYYRMPRELVYDILSSVISEYFSRITHANVVCTVTEGKIDAYIRGTAADKKIALTITEKDMSEIRKRYKAALDISESYRCYQEYSGWHGRIVEGIYDDSETIRIKELENVVGICTGRDLGNTPEKGASAFFYVKNVEVRVESSRVRCVMNLSRTSKELPVKLLQKLMNNNTAKLVCYKRIAGKVSFISSDIFIKRSFIEEISSILSEQVVIKKART